MIREGEFEVSAVHRLEASGLVDNVTIGAAFAEPPAPEMKRLLDALAGPTGVALNNALTHERFQRLAAVDPLTGSYNRRFGLGRLTEEWGRAVRSGYPAGAAVLRPRSLQVRQRHLRPLGS
ncbi:MAG: hypothetical protein ACXVXP_06010 [Mycobacteriaceae bacterium]